MKAKQIGVYLAIAVVAFALVFGIRALRIKQVETRLEMAELVDGLLPEKVLYRGQSYLIPPTSVHNAGITAEDIPAINTPEMVSIASIDERLADTEEGIVVAKDGEARFYSFQILRWHEIVNDEIGGDAIAITHCTLCHSSNVFSRVFDSETIELSTSGLVYDNMSLYTDDSTGAYWLQGTGTSVVGKHLGESLDVYDFEVMSWEAYKDAYPNGFALSMDTGFDFDYGVNPYTNYDTSQTIYFPLTETPGSIALKWMVDGFSVDGESIAFSREVMKGFGAETFQLGETHYIAFYDYDIHKVHVYLLDEARTFTYDFDAEELRDEETGSLWTSAGVAIDGELEGLQLEKMSSQEMFWFCWHSLHPDTAIAKIDAETNEEEETTTE